MIVAHFKFEQTYWSQGKQFIAGIDEVGRGCWAGPVVVGAVIFPQNIRELLDCHYRDIDNQSIDLRLPGDDKKKSTFDKIIITDSKLLSAKRRSAADRFIRQKALAYAIAEIPLEIINEHGIGHAAQVGFHTAIRTLKIQPDFVLIDAFKIKEYPDDRQLNIIKGDQQSISIAAASIIAKVYRDKLMQGLHKIESRFGFKTNKGYGTLAHQRAIAQHGLCEYHRSSFNLIKWTQGASNEIQNTHI